MGHKGYIVNQPLSYKLVVRALLRPDIGEATEIASAMSARAEIS